MGQAGQQGSFTLNRRRAVGVVWLVRNSPSDTHTTHPVRRVNFYVRWAVFVLVVDLEVRGGVQARQVVRFPLVGCGGAAERVDHGVDLSVGERARS